MKSRYLRFLAIVIGIIVIASTGFYREFFFVNINEQMRFLWYGNEVSMMSEKLSFLSSFDYWTLYYLKWTMTLVFSGVFMLETSAFLKVVYQKFYWQEVIFIYGLLLIVSAALFKGYALFDEHESGYLLSRYFMGIAQSPVPLMLLVPAIGLRNRLKSIQ